MMNNGAGGLDWKKELHDFSQPVTRLQSRLYLAQFAGSEAELREVIAGVQEDLKDLIEWMRRARARAEGQQEFAGRAA